MKCRWAFPLLAVFLLGATHTSAAPGSSSPIALGDSLVSDEAFEVSLRPVGTYRAGQAAKAEILVVAKGGYKVNDKYPTKFTFAASSEVEPEARVVTQDAVSVKGKRAVMTLRFTPKASGKRKVSGEFKFSVCTNDRCLVEKRDLRLTLTVQ